MNKEWIKQKLRKYKLYHILVFSIMKLKEYYLLIFELVIYLCKNKSYKGKLCMSSLYSDHMILQCDERLKVEGKAKPGEWINVSIDRQMEETYCQSDGNWMVELQPLKAGGPYVLEIKSSSKKLVYRDVYAGEIWLCSGQSNMAVTMNRYQEEGYYSKDQPFRCIVFDAIWPPYASKWTSLVSFFINNLHYVKAKGWKDCTRETINSLSSIAYYYGYEISLRLHKPIGLIVNPLGGSAEYSWIERRCLQIEYPEILTNWFENTKVTSWMKGRARQNIGKQVSQHEQLHPYYPGYCYEVFIRPIKDYTIKGVIWFCGESSAQLNDTGLFECMQEMLIRNWRKSFGINFPFYYVQLHGMNYEQTFGKGLHYYYPEIRNSQRRLLSKIPNTGMAVSYDLSVIDNVHFKNRKPVGERLARLALHNTYEINEIIPCGPLFHEAQLRENLIYIRFEWSEGLCTKDDGELKTFEVAGKDRFFYPAKAWIEEEEVVLSCPEVAEPVWVHYAYDEYPIDANLINGEGLPAACFEDQICQAKV